MTTRNPSKGWTQRHKALAALVAVLFIGIATSGQEASKAYSSESFGGSSGPAIPKGPIGFVGCSNSRDTVLGYIADGGTRLWKPDRKTYGAGVVLRWSNLSSRYWDQFSAMYAAQPGTKVIWWSLCTHPEAIESDAANYSAALKVLANIEKRIPGVTVYASALNSYVAPHVCSLTGANGPSRMQALAERLASEGRLRLGPNVGSLRSWERDGDPNNSAGATAANDQTVDDGCHPNRIGEALLGNSLIKFFGK